MTMTTIKDKVDMVDMGIAHTNNKTNTNIPTSAKPSIHPEMKITTVTTTAVAMNTTTTNHPMSSTKANNTISTNPSLIKPN